MIIFIIPKNSGLEVCSDLVNQYQYKGKIVKIRGEDVPLFVSKLINEGKSVIGLTGEDLFEEFKLNNKFSIEIKEKISWPNNNFIFNKPALCLLGPEDKNINLKDELTICLNSKYEKIGTNFINNYFKNKKINIILVNGASEEFYCNSEIDLVIDIVCTGKSIREAGLIVYEKIFESDIVLIGGKNVNSKY